RPLLQLGEGALLVAADHGQPFGEGIDRMLEQVGDVDGHDPKLERGARGGKSGVAYRVGMPTLTDDGKTWVLNLGADENRFSPSWVGELKQALDVVEAGDGPAVLVTTGSGKTYSNGLDQEFLAAHTGAPAIWEYMARVQAVLARLLVVPIPTVAA